MKKRTAFLIYSSFILILVFIFPMRGIVSLLDDKDKMRINSIEGFWWKGSLEGVALAERSLGDIKVNFSPISLIINYLLLVMFIENPPYFLRILFLVILQFHLFYHRSQSLFCSLQLCKFIDFIVAIDL